MAISLTTVLAVSTLLVVSATAQKQCLPEILIPARAIFETYRDILLPTNPCPLSADSDLIKEAVDFFFPIGDIVPESCTVSVSRVQCDPRELRSGFWVKVWLHVKLNCSSNPCLGADADTITNALFDTEFRRIKDLDLKKLQLPQNATFAPSNGMILKAKAHVRIDDAHLSAVCGDTVVKENEVKEFREGADNNSRRKSKKGKKGPKNDAEVNIEDIRCDCEDYCLAN